MPRGFLPLPFHLARARHRPDRRVRARHPAPRRRCDGSRPRPACRRCCALRSETAHCGRCPAVFAAPAPHRATGPSGPALVCARLKPGAAPRDVALARAHKFLRSSLPPGTREPVSLLWHYTTQPIILRRRFYELPTRKESSCMAKKRGEPRKYAIPTSFEQARDELFSHTLPCALSPAPPAHPNACFHATLPSPPDRSAAPPP